MSKLFAIIIPIFSILITTLVIVLSKDNGSTRINKKRNLVLLGMGLLVFLIIAGVFFLFK